MRRIFLSKVVPVQMKDPDVPSDDSEEEISWNSSDDK
nr:hypothetical protein [Tanacetum cinerariifolium]